MVYLYSVFSPGSFLERSPAEKFVSLALNELFNLNIEYDDEELIKSAKEIANKLANFAVELNGISGFLPNDFKHFYPENYGVKNRVGEHMKYNKKEVANSYLVRTLLLAKHLKHKVCIVVPPARSDYTKAIGIKFELLFKSLLEILNEFHLGYDASLINGFDSELFSDSHFGDFDHLLPLGKGTEIFTKLIYEKFSKT